MSSLTTDYRKIATAQAKILADTRDILTNLQSTMEASIDTMEREEYDDIFFLNNMRVDVAKLRVRVSRILDKTDTQSSD